MIKKLAKLKYLPNNFKIIEEGDHVICAISGKVIKLEELNYWNVDLQEAYYSYVEASKKKENKSKLFLEWLESDVFDTRRLSHVFTAGDDESIPNILRVTAQVKDANLHRSDFLDSDGQLQTTKPQMQVIKERISKMKTLRNQTTRSTMHVLSRRH